MHAFHPLPEEVARPTIQGLQHDQLLRCGSRKDVNNPAVNNTMGCTVPYQSLGKGITQPVTGFNNAAVNKRSLGHALRCAVLPMEAFSRTLHGVITDS